MKFKTEDGTEVHIMSIPTAEDDPLELVMRAVEADLDEKGWDQGPLMMAITAQLGFSGMETIQMPEPFYYRPVDFLQLFVQGFDETAPDEEIRVRLVTFLREKVLPESYAGLAFFYEAWCVSGEAGEDRQLPPDVEEMANRRELHLHPDRVEMRAGYAITVDGRTAVVSRKRGEFPEAGDGGDHEGRIVTAMSRLNAIFAEIQPNPFAGVQS